MQVTLVNVYVQPEHVDDFIEATCSNHKSSIQESGNLRFDVLQSLDNPQHFILYEAYATEEDAAAHKNTRHYLKWRDTVQDWMVKPREGIRFKGICP